MRLRRLPVLVMLTVPLSLLGAPSSTASASQATLSQCPDLALGYHGGCVNELQFELNEVQDPDVGVDGYFGPLTKAAVVKFQADHGLPQDGIAGPVTKAALGNELSVATPRPGPPAITPAYPSSFDPDRAAAWAAGHFSETNTSPWRSGSKDVTNHCTEFVSAALHQGGLPYTGSWHPGTQGLEVRRQKAYYVTNSLRDWLTGHDKWMDAQPIALDDPRSASRAGARPGDIIYYSWDGQETAHSSHLAMVVQVSGDAVTVVDQGEATTFNRRLWYMGRSQPDKTIRSLAGDATATLLHWRR